KERFLKSSKFDVMCSNKALIFFECGFKGCLAQFRANSYSEEEHPDSFLNFVRALEDMSEKEKRRTRTPQEMMLQPLDPDQS
ncbi:hypothetical protein F511_35953, partial [Dorcoceras hygrometricum]